MSKKLDRAIRDLEKARKRLVPDQLRTARRNARWAVMDALKKAREALDSDYPGIRIPRKPNKTRKRKGPPSSRYIDIVMNLNSAERAELLAACAEAKTPVRSKEDNVYIPKWAFAIYKEHGSNVHRLREAKSSKAIRQTAMASLYLKNLK